MTQPLPRAAPPPSLIGMAVSRGRKVRTHAARDAATRAWRRLQPVSLSVAGVGCLAGAAWTVGIWAGLLATGAALLALEWRITN